MAPEYFYTLLWLKDEFFMKPEVITETQISFLVIVSWLEAHLRRTEETVQEVGGCVFQNLHIRLTAVKLEAQLCSHMKWSGLVGLCVTQGV